MRNAPFLVRSIEHLLSDSNNGVVGSHSVVQVDMNRRIDTPETRLAGVSECIM